MRERFLLGDSAGAKEDLEKSLDLVPDYVQSLVKVASVHMEMGTPIPVAAFHYR